ncbi:Glutamine-dependent NAD(+) synthetase [Streptomyces violarus]
MSPSRSARTSGRTAARPAARSAGAGLLLSINASPYERDKDDTRLDLVRKRAQEAGCTTAYLAMIGGQDELVFDGTIVVDKEGEVIARAPQFSEGSVILDLELPAAATVAPSGVVDDGLRIDHVVLCLDRPVDAYEPELTGGYAERLDDDEEIYSALVVGLRAYAAKNGFSSVLLGLSGGIDSALCAAIARHALGAENVYGVSMPSKYSSDHSKGDAAELARRTGLYFCTVSIAPMFDAYMEALGLTGLAEENLQARLRGTTLMGISNQEGRSCWRPATSRSWRSVTPRCTGTRWARTGRSRTCTSRRCSGWRVAQPGGGGAGADPADPRGLDHQAAERGAAAGAGGHGLAAGLRRARRAA